MKIVIVCDWLVGGGAEKVVEQLHKLYPDAPIYTSYCTPEWRRRLDNKVVTGYLQYWPFSKLRKFIPFLRGWWFSTLNLDGFNLVVSSSGAEAKFIKVKSGAKHIAYIHAPTHYYWSRYEEYLKKPGFGRLNWLARIGLKLLVGPMRRWDYKAAQQPDQLIANSTHTAEMVKKYYGRESVVIFPPVDTKRFAEVSGDKSQVKRKGFVVVGRQTPYKRIDLPVAACTLLNIPLTVIGNGPEHSWLVSNAGPAIKFIKDATDSETVEILQKSEAFIFPGLDDFGIAPVEAMAAGTPVIAYKGGGALDYVVRHETGLFFAEQTLDSLVFALKRFEFEKFNHNEIQKAATKFSIKEFKTKFMKLVG